MSDSFWQDDQQNQPEQQSGMKALRDAYERQKSENAALTERLAKLEADARKREFTSFLPAGVSPKVVDFIPANIEAKPESVKAWLEQYADVFIPKAAPTEGQPGAEGEEQQKAPEVPPAWAEAMQRVTSGESGAQEMTRFAGELERARKVADEVNTLDDFRRAMGG